jgi:hypothetical protein
MVFHVRSIETWPVVVRNHHVIDGLAFAILNEDKRIKTIGTAS